MVVNSDGVCIRPYIYDKIRLSQTVSRIANWAEMSEIERERTFRILAKRNQQVSSFLLNYTSNVLSRIRLTGLAADGQAADEQLEASNETSSATTAK